MSLELTEEEMRKALFGLSGVKSSASTSSTASPIHPKQKPEKTAVTKPHPRAKPLSPKLRVILNVTREFEGEEQVFIYDVDTLSTLIAELEAKSAAKKKRFKYFEVVSIKPTS